MAIRLCAVGIVIAIRRVAHMVAMGVADNSNHATPIVFLDYLLVNRQTRVRATRIHILTN